MTTMTMRAERTLDEVETDLTRIEADKARLVALELRLLREAEAMQAHTVDGARTMADWAAARLDLAPETARVLVATARTLGDHPDLEHMLHEGLASVDRTVELARAVAAGVDVPDHREHDVAGLRRIVARRRVRIRTTDREAFESRYLVIQPSLDHSRWRFHGLLTGEDGATVEGALDRRADHIADGTGEREPLPRRRADALVDLCRTDGPGVPSDPLVAVFVDRDGATIDGHLPVGPDVVAEALCSGSVEVIDTSDPGRPLARGRRTRVISRRLRRTILHRDGGRCVIDGCQSRYRLQPHHLVPWSEGGRTDPDNLVTLCWFHHHVVVHGRGRRIDPTSPPLRRRFIREPRRGPPV